MKEKRIIALFLLIISGISLVSANGNNQSSVNESDRAIKIIDIIPHEAPMLVPVNFVVLVEGNKSYNYEWDFGDGTTDNANAKKTVHAYKNIGAYDLNVRVFNSSDESSKTVEIEVVPPINSINKTIADYKKKLSDVEKEINKIERWVGDEVKLKINLNALKGEVGKQENRTKDGYDEQEAISIMEELMGINLPKKFGASMSINKVNFIQDENRLDFSVLEGIGAGEFKEDRYSYVKGINNWVMENLELKVESKTYALYFDEKTEDVLSHVKVSLMPKKDLDKFYFIIDSEDAKFLDSRLKKVSGKIGGGFELKKNEDYVIEFLYPQKVLIDEVPVYVSPEESELNLEVVVGICNNDGICDEDESNESCPNDCKRWLSTSMMLFILLAIAFVAYIILQEWYKRFYERRLFSDRNQLFNLVHFMNNSFNQGMKKPVIFSRLENRGWKTEQLNYAWKKLNGKRTGMWEIPVFKWAENRRVKSELEKRGGRIGQGGFGV